MNNRLAAPGAGGGLAATIRPGMRACAVKVNDVVGVAGFATPGMRVDVLITGNPPGSNPTAVPRVRTILQNIEVLSAGTDISKDAEGKPQQVQVVNLLVTPEQAELLSLAGNETHIQLVLRNPLDTKFSQTQGTSVASLFGDAPAKAQPAAAPRRPVVKEPPRVYMVEVINGSKRSEEKFVANEDKQ
jgi:pilus assembly protein CpaB